MRLPYTLEYFPPAPALEIRLALPGHAFDSESVRSLLDTGSDTSVIPLRYIQRLGAQIDDRKYVRGAWGERRAVYTYQLDVEVAGMRLPNIEVVADEQNVELLVGRNLLNKLVLVLDGPAQTVDLRE